MLSLFPQLLDFQFYGPLFLRIALGAIFLVHGYKKLINDKSGFAGYLESLKFRPGKFWVWLIALVEFFGGILLVLGIFMQPAALVLAIEFLVILFWVRRNQPFVARQDATGMSWEFDFLIFMALLALLVLGPGAWAIDLPL